MIQTILEELPLFPLGDDIHDDLAACISPVQLAKWKFLYAEYPWYYPLVQEQDITTRNVIISYLKHQTGFQSELLHTIGFKGGVEEKFALVQYDAILHFHFVQLHDDNWHLYKISLVDDDNEGYMPCLSEVNFEAKVVSSDEDEYWAQYDAQGSVSQPQKVIQESLQDIDHVNTDDEHYFSRYDQVQMDIPDVEGEQLTAQLKALKTHISGSETG